MESDVVVPPLLVVVLRLSGAWEIERPAVLAVAGELLLL
jgi:hypothetical protein